MAIMKKRDPLTEQWVPVAGTVPGEAATVQIGTVSTSEPGGAASVTNVGTPEAAILDIVLPRAADGDDGDSAFQIAESQGFTGTLAEWLESLNGEDGAAATIEIGTVTTGDPGTEVTITNSGTDTEVILDITIPRGATGAAGAGVPDATEAPAGQVPVTDGEGGYALGQPSSGGYAPDPAAEADGRMLYTEDGELVYGDPPAGGSGNLASTNLTAVNTTDDPNQEAGAGELLVVLPTPRVVAVANSEQTYGGADSITSISATVPMDVEAGDMILAFLGHAPYAITPHSGYGLEVTAPGVGDRSANGLRSASIYSHEATGVEGGTTVTFTMGTAGRVSLTLVVVRSGSGGVEVEATSGANYSASAEPGAHPVPSVISEGRGRLALALGACALALASGDTTVGVPNGWTLLTPQSAAASPSFDRVRSWVISRPLAEGENTAVTVGHNPPDHDGSASLVILVAT